MWYIMLSAESGWILLDRVEHDQLCFFSPYNCFIWPYIIERNAWFDFFKNLPDRFIPRVIWCVIALLHEICLQYSCEGWTYCIVLFFFNMPNIFLYSMNIMYCVLFLKKNVPCIFVYILNIIYWILCLKYDCLTFKSNAFWLLIKCVCNIRAYFKHNELRFFAYNVSNMIVYSLNIMPWAFGLNYSS